MRRTALVLLLGGLALPSCGYFNSLYNAQRRFAEAERAAQRGEREVARAAYQSAVEKAAVSYRNHPGSRWADDALLLVGRSRFAMAEYAAARAALGRVLEQSRDDEVRAMASLYLGASLAALGHADSALAPLGQALAAVKRGAPPHTFALLWQGRARLALDDAQGWTDLESAAAHDDRMGLEAALELAQHAALRGDSARTGRALARLLAMRAAEPRADSVAALVAHAARRWGAPAVLGWIPERPAAQWGPEPRTRLQAELARLTAAAGDTARAIGLLTAAAQHSRGLAAAEARELAARWMLARLDGAEQLAQVRAVLLPAIAQPGPVLQIRRLRTLEVLIERARTGQSAALFAAAELARDTLRAPRLARQLFLAYADVAGTTVWAPKALLAALPLSTDGQRAELLERLQRAPDNPYVAAVQGRTDTAAFYAAEERLGRAVMALHADAVAEAAATDVRVTRAVMELDSLRVLARTDSLRLRCGTLLDSLALRGIRGDSVRSACLRSDSAGVVRYLAVDTTLLRPKTPADSARRTRVVRDTLVP